MTILNLGAGNKLMSNAVNHDLRKHRPEIDIAWDLNELPWPWDDRAFDMIVAKAVLEHLRINLLESVNECWRILRPGGIIYLKLPFWDSDNTYLDPTHYWRFSLRTCDMFDPETEYGRKYGFYPVLKWKIIQAAKMNNSRTSFALKMQVVK